MRRLLLQAAVIATVLALASPPASASSVNPQGSYKNPFRSVQGLVAERIDMGVDFSGVSGPIYPLGPAVIKGTTGAGWGQGGVLYKLTGGPARGKWVYVAECILNVPSHVHVGEQVTSRTSLGTISLSCGTGIEMGWAVPGNEPEIAPMAGSCFVQYPDGTVDPTWYGKNMNHLLMALGVPPGQRQHPHVSCAPNPSYPTWS